jgi:hypothetical protein
MSKLGIGDKSASNAGGGPISFVIRFRAVPRYYRVTTYTGNKAHYAKEKAGKPYMFTMCGISWKTNKGPGRDEASR